MRQSRLIRLIQYALNSVLLLLLSLQLILLVCIGLNGHIPLPSKWINAQLKAYAIEGIYPQADSLQLHLNGQLTISNLGLYLDGIDDSLLDIEHTTLSITDWNPRHALTDSINLVLSGGTLYIPASFAPNGQHTPLFEHISLELNPAEQQIHLQSLCFQHEDISFRSNARIPFASLASLQDDSAPETTPTDDAPPEIDLHQTLQHYYTLISKHLVESREKYHYFDTPTILITVQGSDDPNRINIGSRILSPCANYQNNEAHEIIIELRAALDRGELVFDENSYLNIQELIAPDYSTRAEQVRLHMTSDAWKQLEGGQWPSIEFSAASIGTKHAQIDNPSFQAWEAAPSVVAFDGSFSGIGGGVTCSGQVDLAQQSGAVQLNGSLDIYALLPPTVKATLPALHFPTAPDYQVEAKLGEQWQLDEVNFEVDIHQVTADQLTFQQIYANGSYRNDTLDIHNINVVRNEQQVHASLHYDHSSGMLDILARGRVNPKDYSPLLPAWWDSIFTTFTIDNNSQLHADFLVQVDINAPSMTNLYGTVDVNDIAYSNTPVTSGQVLVRGTEAYIHIGISDLIGDEGTGDGIIGLSLIDGTLAALHLDIDTQLSTTAFRNILGTATYESILGFIESPTTPDLQLQGSLYFADDFPQLANKDNIRFTVDIPGPFELKDVPLERAKLNGIYTPHGIQIRDLNYGFAGGTGTGNLDILLPNDSAGELRIQAQLNDANKAQVMRKVQQATAASDESYQSDPDYESADDASLSAKLHFTIPLDNMYQPNGYSWITLYDPNLGTIRTLGPLSEILEGTLLNFTSFELDRLNADITLQNGYATFTEATITGPKMLVDITGDIHIKDQTLDLKVAVELFKDTLKRDSIIGRPIKAITDIFDPIRTLLRFEVTGTIDKQRFRSAYDPRNLIPKNLLPDLGLF